MTKFKLYITLGLAKQHDACSSGLEALIAYQKQHNLLIDDDSPINVLHILKGKGGVQDCIWALRCTLDIKLSCKIAVDISKRAAARAAAYAADAAYAARAYAADAADAARAAADAAYAAAARADAAAAYAAAARAAARAADAAARADAAAAYDACAAEREKQKEDLLRLLEDDDNG